MNGMRRRRALIATVRRAPAPALLFLSILGWAALVWLTAAAAARGDLAHPGRAIDAVHAGHATDAVTGVAGITLAPHGLAMWLAMVVAMSPLLLLREVSRLRQGSLRRTRTLTLLAFAGGYGAAWTLAGLIAVPVAEALARSVRLGVPAVVLAIAWQCSPARQRLLNLCHRAPRLRVFGPAALWDACRYGVVTGAACAASCGPIMVLVLLATDLHLVAMLGATALIVVERYLPARRPRWRLPLTPARPEHVTLQTGPGHGRRDPATSSRNSRISAVTSRAFSMWGK